MTTRADILAATPKCPGPVTHYDEPRVTCGRVLKWLHEQGAWLCEKHGVVLSGDEAGRRAA